MLDSISEKTIKRYLGRSLSQVGLQVSRQGHFEEFFSAHEWSSSAVSATLSDTSEQYEVSVTFDEAQRTLSSHCTCAFSSEHQGQSSSPRRL